MMDCSKRGDQIIEDSKICGTCGNAVINKSNEKSPVLYKPIHSGNDSSHNNHLVKKGSKINETICLIGAIISGFFISGLMGIYIIYVCLAYL